MGREIDEVISSLPSERQAKIQALADKKVKEMLAAATTLADIRNAVGRTQSAVAEDLRIKQNAISQMERRSDTYVSTLRKFLQTLGLRLELSVVTDSGERFELPNFHPWKSADAVALGETEEASTEVARKAGNPRTLANRRARPKIAAPKVAAPQNRPRGKSQRPPLVQKKRAHAE